MNKRITIPHCGIHVKYDAIPTLQDNKEFDANFSAVQIFTFNPRKVLSPIPMDYDKVKESCKYAKLRLYIHTSYTVTFSTISALTARVGKELNVARKLEAYGIIIHLPKKSIDFLIPFIKALNDMNKPDDNGYLPIIFLEFKALKPDDKLTYETAVKFNKLTACMLENKIDQSRIKICLDTAHLYASSVTDVINAKSAAQYLISLDKTYIGLIHLNGNENHYSKAQDKHAIPLALNDKIWGGMKYDDTGCKVFINYAKYLNIDYILEIKEQHTFKEVNKFLSNII